MTSLPAPSFGTPPLLRLPDELIVAVSTFLPRLIYNREDSDKSLLAFEQSCRRTRAILMPIRCKVSRPRSTWRPKTRTLIRPAGLQKVSMSADGRSPVNSIEVLALYGPHVRELDIVVPTFYAFSQDVLGALATALPACVRLEAFTFRLSGGYSVCLQSFLDAFTSIGPKLRHLDLQLNWQDASLVEAARHCLAHAKDVVSLSVRLESVPSSRAIGDPDFPPLRGSDRLIELHIPSRAYLPAGSTAPALRKLHIEFFDRSDLTRLASVLGDSLESLVFDLWTSEAPIFAEPKILLPKLHAVQYNSVRLPTFFFTDVLHADTPLETVHLRGKLLFDCPETIYGLQRLLLKQKRRVLKRVTIAETCGTDHQFGADEETACTVGALSQIKEVFDTSFSAAHEWAKDEGIEMVVALTHGLTIA